MFNPTAVKAAVRQTIDLSGRTLYSWFYYEGFQYMAYLTISRLTHLFDFITLAIPLWKHRLFLASKTICQRIALTPSFQV